MNNQGAIARSIRPNLLGDVRAEADTAMLDSAFYESPDYRTLIESKDRCVIVGRRGTGKSAIAYRLGKYFDQVEGGTVVRFGPDEDEMIGLRPLIRLFGENFRTARAGASIAWRYAFLMQIADGLRHGYKVRKDPAFQALEPKLSAWRKGGDTLAGRLKYLLRQVVPTNANSDSIVGDLAARLEVAEVERLLRTLVADRTAPIVMLLDRLDEGYEPDAPGIALVDGLVHAAIDVSTKLSNVRPLVFLRDNIFRAVAKMDPDFSRGIEGQTIRLHWDEYALLNLIANRMRVAFRDDIEKNIKVWDRHVADGPHGLAGTDGFRRCLRMTLYRPRDLLILLNNAFYGAQKANRDRIADEDVSTSAKSISTHRLDDLIKEYTVILPSLGVLTAAFAGGASEMTLESAEERVVSAMSRDDLEPAALQHFQLMRSPSDCVRDLYSVGFLGLKDANAGHFVFCHDGRDIDRSLSRDTTLLVHPCYWLALGLSSGDISPDHAQEIYDDYEINVSSETPKRRAAEIGRLIAEEGTISNGSDGWRNFEDWVHRALSIVFAGRLRNIELRPNGQATQRRDIVATNLAESPFWKRVLEDYKSRQVIFEVKNYADLIVEDFHQVLAYSDGFYGHCVFIICRCDDDNLRKGAELDQVRVTYQRHKTLVVKLSAKTLCSWLSKLRSPQKHDVADKHLNGLVDRYLRMYLEGGKS